MSFPNITWVPREPGASNSFRLGTPHGWARSHGMTCSRYVCGIYAVCRHTARVPAVPDEAEHLRGSLSRGMILQSIVYLLFPTHHPRGAIMPSTCPGLRQDNQAMLVSKASRSRSAWSVGILADSQVELGRSDSRPRIWSRPVCRVRIQTHCICTSATVPRLTGHTSELTERMGHTTPEPVDLMGRGQR